MKINNINSTNFDGGFRFQAVTPDVRCKMDEISKRGKQIFDNFENEGDVFLVVRDNLVLKVAKFIEDNELKNFEYYPNVNTNCGLDSEKHGKLSSLLKKVHPVEFITKEVIARAERREKLNFVKQNSPIYTKNILKGLQICVENPKVKTKYGAKIIEDKVNKRIILISPPNEKGHFYVRVENLKSTSSNEFVSRYKMTYDGEKVSSPYETNDIAEFNRCLNSTYIK